MTINFTATWSKLTAAEITTADAIAETFEDENDDVEVEFGVGNDTIGVPFRFFSADEASDHIDTLLDRGDWGKSDDTELFVFARIRRWQWR